MAKTAAMRSVFATKNLAKYLRSRGSDGELPRLLVGYGWKRSPIGPLFGVSILSVFWRLESRRFDSYPGGRRHQESKVGGRGAEGTVRMWFKRRLPCELKWSGKRRELPFEPDAKRQPLMALKPLMPAMQNAKKIARK